MNRICSPLAAVFVLASSVSACDGSASSGATGSVSVAVAPLTLPGITDADYTLTVTNAAGGAGEVVWTRSLTSTAYGDGAGSLSYVGTCDADAGTNTVRLELDALYDAGGAVDPTTYFDPTPVELEVTCVADADAAVTFDLTIARAATQGFFDVAVAFDDIFCSAKLDCVNADTGGDLELLHNPATGARDLTAVLGLACTGAVGGSTWLYLDNPVIACAGLGDPVVVDVSGQGLVDLSAAPSANVDGYLFAASVFRGLEQVGSVAYWSISFGLNADVFATAGACTLTARATAADHAFPQGADGFPLPEGSTYPVIDWSVPLSDAARVCTSHAINAADGYVATTYLGPGTSDPFDHRYDSAAGTLDSVTAPPVGSPLWWFDAGQISGLSDGAAVASWPDRSGNGYDAFQAAAGAQPTYVSDAYGGRPGVRFDGADDLLGFPGPGTATSAVSIFAVYRVRAGATGNAYYPFTVGPQYTGAVDDGQFIGFETLNSLSGASEDVLDVIGGTSRDARATLAGISAYDGLTVISSVSSGTIHNTTVRANGADAAMSTTGTDVALNVVLSGAGGTNRTGIGGVAVGGYFKGEILEVLVYDSAVDAASRAAIEGYLLAKYGAP